MSRYNSNRNIGLTSVTSFFAFNPNHLKCLFFKSKKKQISLVLRFELLPKPHHNKRYKKITFGFYVRSATWKARVGLVSLSQNRYHSKPCPVRTLRQMPGNTLSSTIPTCKYYSYSFLTWKFKSFTCLSIKRN